MSFTANKSFLPSFGFNQIIDYPNGTTDVPFQVTFCFKAGGMPQAIQYGDAWDDTTVDLAEVEPSTGKWMPNAYIPKYTGGNQLIVDFLPFLLTGCTFAFTRGSGNPISVSPSSLSMYQFEVNGCSRITVGETLGSANFEFLESGANKYTVSRAHYAGGKHPYGALIWATGTSGMSAPSTLTGATSGDTFNVSNYKEFPIELDNDDPMLRVISQVGADTMEYAGAHTMRIGSNTLQSAQNTSRVATMAFYEGGGTAPTEDYSFGIRAYYGTSIHAPSNFEA
jgi:hypothetical protein